MITDIEFNEAGNIRVTDDGKVKTVPWPMASINSDLRLEIQEWLDAGNTITPFAPAEEYNMPSIQEQIDTLYSEGNFTPGSPGDIMADRVLKRPNGPGRQDGG